MRLLPVILLMFTLLPAVIPARAGDATDKRPSWFVFLERGQPAPADKAAVQKMQMGHIQNFKRLFAEKKLFAAGPMQDPAQQKRGMVVVKAKSHKQLLGYFDPDEYVRDGYLTVNARRCVVHKALNTENIDPDGIEEVRIVQITRPTTKPGRRENKLTTAFLQSLVDQGVAGAWYTLEGGDVAEVLFCHSKDTKALEAAFEPCPILKTSSARLLVWPQWLGKGVVK